MLILLLLLLLLIKTKRGFFCLFKRKMLKPDSVLWNCGLYLLFEAFSLALAS